MRQVCAGLMAALLVVGCAPADYPSDWPRVASSLLSGKGGCPDLSGDFDGVDGSLLYLLGRDPDFEKSIRFQPEHRATLTMAADGKTLEIATGVNERGLAVFRERMLTYNQEYVHVDQVVRLKRGNDYDCAGGWLHSLHFPQAQAQHGMRRMELRVARDADDGLIAGARLRIDQSVGWGDSRGIPLWARNETRWYRWPSRPREADAALAAAQSVTLHRYGWINHGRSVPTRFTSFYVEPICLRYEQYGRFSAPHGPEMRRGRDAIGPPPPECPKGWGKFDLGEVFRTGMDLPNDTPQRYRFVWFVLSEGEQAQREIVVTNPMTLPLMPGEKERSSKREPTSP